MQDGCEVYMDSYMASNRSCFMVAWTAAFENHLLEVGLPQIQRPRHSQLLIYCILSCVRTLHGCRFIEVACA